MTVTNTPGVLTRATAELTIALILSLLRRVTEGDRLIRRGEDWIWAPNLMLGRGLDGLMLGLVGHGRIGKEVETARSCPRHGRRVLHPQRWAAARRPARRRDVVCLHLPLTDETRHLIDAAALAPDEAGCGAREHEPRADRRRGRARHRAREGRIAGAALDVFEHEPEVDPGLLVLENVVLAPHLGSATLETREAMGMLCVEALRAVLLEGRVPENAV